MERENEETTSEEESTMVKYGLRWLSSVEVTGRLRRALTISGILTLINTRHNGTFWHFKKRRRALNAAVKSWAQLKARDGHRQFVPEYWQLCHANHWRRLFYFIYLIPANNTAPFQLSIVILNTNKSGKWKDEALYRTVLSRRAKWCQIVLQQSFMWHEIKGEKLLIIPVHDLVQSRKQLSTHPELNVDYYDWYKINGDLGFF